MECKAGVKLSLPGSEGKCRRTVGIVGSQGFPARLRFLGDARGDWAMGSMPLSKLSMAFLGSPMSSSSPPEVLAPQ